MGQRKISELPADELFDFIYAMSPILPVISQLDIVKTGFSSITNYLPTAEDVAEMRAVAERKLSKKERSPEEIAKNLQKEAKKRGEMVAIIVNELPTLIPHLVAKENRIATYEMLSILNNVPADEVKSWPGPKLVNQVISMVKDPGFKDFLDYAESLDTEK